MRFYLILIILTFYELPASAFLKKRAPNSKCWTPGTCSDNEPYSGKVNAFGGMKMTKHKCLRYCSIFGRADCRSFSVEPKKQSCTFYNMPCSERNLSCRDCSTWTGKCRLPYLPKADKIKSAAMTTDIEKDFFNCEGVSLGNCNHEQPIVTTGLGLQDCQDKCNQDEESQCKSILYGSESNQCKLLPQDLSNIIKTCGKIGAAKTCKTSNAKCVLLETNCTHNDAMEEIHKVGSFNQCQMFCTMNRNCSYFIYDFRSSTCSLLEDDTMNCKETISASDADLSKCESLQIGSSMVNENDPLKSDLSAVFNAATTSTFYTSSTSMLSSENGTTKREQSFGTTSLTSKVTDTTTVTPTATTTANITAKTTPTSTKGNTAATTTQTNVSTTTSAAKTTTPLTTTITTTPTKTSSLISISASSITSTANTMSTTLAAGSKASIKTANASTISASTSSTTATTGSSTATTKILSSVVSQKTTVSSSTSLSTTPQLTDSTSVKDETKTGVMFSKESTSFAASALQLTSFTSSVIAETTTRKKCTSTTTTTTTSSTISSFKITASSTTVLSKLPKGTSSIINVESTLKKRKKLSKFKKTKHLRKIRRKKRIPKPSLAKDISIGQPTQISTLEEDTTTSKAEEIVTDATDFDTVQESKTALKIAGSKQQKTDKKLQVGGLKSLKENNFMTNESNHNETIAANIIENTTASKGYSFPTVGPTAIINYNSQIEEAKINITKKPTSSTTTSPLSTPTTSLTAAQSTIASSEPFSIISHVALLKNITMTTATTSSKMETKLQKDIKFQPNISELFCNVCQERLTFFMDVCQMKEKYGPMEYRKCVVNAKNLMKKCLPCVCEILSHFLEIDCKV